MCEILSLSVAVKLTNFEMIFIRYLHLLAHHPDYALTPEVLPDLAKYIDFYLDQIASVDTVSLLYYLAGRLKSVRDARSHAHSEVRNTSTPHVSKPASNRSYLEFIYHK
jgi:sister chromatid cohesion protein PDS5